MYSYENSTGKVNTHNRLHLLAIFLDYWHDNYGTGVLQTQRTCIQFMSTYCDQFRSIMLIIEYTLLIQINMCMKIFKKIHCDLYTCNDLYTCSQNLAIFFCKLVNLAFNNSSLILLITTCYTLFEIFSTSISSQFLDSCKKRNQTVKY